MSTQNAGYKVGTLIDTPADPILHPSARQSIGTQQFFLCGPKDHVCLPLVLQRNNGRLYPYLLLKAMVPNADTRNTQRLLIPVWLLISANPGLSIGPDGRRYVRNNNHGAVHMINSMMYGSMLNARNDYVKAVNEDKANGGTGASIDSDWMKKAKLPINSIIAQVSPRKMAAPTGELGVTITNGATAFFNQSYSVTELFHAALMGGTWKKRLPDGTFSTNERDHVDFSGENICLNNTEAMERFLSTQHESTRRIYNGMIERRMVETNTVFEVMPDSIQLITGMFYNSPIMRAMMEDPTSGITGPKIASSWYGTININTSVNATETGNGTTLEHGVRIIREGSTAARYGFDRVGTIYDGSLNPTECRLSMVDPVTINYIKGANPAAEDDGEHTQANNRRSRSQTLEEVVQASPILRYENATMRVHPAAPATKGEDKKNHSMLITIDLEMDNNSSYTVVRDNSKISNLVTLEETDDLFLALGANLDASAEGLAETVHHLDDNTGFKVVDTGTKTQADDDKAHATVGAEDNDLPF